jgi:hypothetical protein
MKGYFTSRLNSNLTWFAQNYKAGNANVSPMGTIEYNSGQVGPWQADFVSLVFSWLAENQEPGAQTYLNWLTRFTVGRFTNEAAGFCAAKADGYYWNTKSNGTWINNWKTLFDTNYSSLANTPCSSIPYDDDGCAYCYGANAQAMLGAAANATISSAKAAFTSLKSKYPLINKAFLGDPSWAIIPR